MGSGEVFRLGATTPPNAFAHAGAYVQASAQADWSLRRGIDFTAGFDLQGKVDAEAGSSGVGGSFAAGVDVSGALAVQAELPIDLFSADGAGLIARLQAKLALTAFVSAALTLDRSVLEQTLRVNFGEPMSSLLDIVLEELDLEAGLWGRASLAIEALGEAVLAGTLVPSADNGAGLTFSTCYDTAFGYGAGVHFLANLGFSNPQRLFTRLTGEVSDQLLALVTPSDPDQSAAVSVGLGALHTLLPVAIRGLLQLGMSLTGDPPAAEQTAVGALASSLIAQAQQIVLQAVTDLATGLLGDALTDARLVSALSRLTSGQLDTVTGQLTTLQNNFEALTAIAISDIDQWLTGLLTCLGTVSDLLNSLTGLGIRAELIGNVQSWTAMLWAAGTLIQRIISWADDASPGSPFSTDPVTPVPPASVAATVKPAGGSVTYSDVAAYLIGSQVASADLETALRTAIPQAAAAFDWLNTVLQITPGQLIQSLFQELAAPTDQQAAALIGQLTTAAADALTNHILPELLDPLAATAAADPNLLAFVEDVVKPALAALPQVILPGLAGLGNADAPTRTREVVSALLLHTIEHFVATTLKALVDHAMMAAQAALNQAAADVTAAGADSPAVKDIEALAIVLLATCSEAAVLVPTPGDVANLLKLAGTVAAHLQQLADDLFALIDELMQFGLGSDATRSASLQALADSDLPVDQTGLSQALTKVGDGALQTIGDVLSDLPTLIADHAANEVALFGQVIDQAAGKVVQAIKDGISAIEQQKNQLGQLITRLGGEIQRLIGDLGQALIQFGQYLQTQTFIQQALEAVRNAGLQIIYSLFGGHPPHSWVQHAIVDLYNTLFDAVEGLADLLAGILGAAATALGSMLTAAAGGAHVTPDTADATVRQGMLAASSTDLNFDLQVKAFGATLLDLGTITISAGNIGGLLHGLVSADGTYQSTLEGGLQTATQAAGLTAQQAAAQTQAATGSTDLTGLQMTVASITLQAPPAVQIIPAPSSTVLCGARVLVTVFGVNSSFVEPTLGMAPRIVIRINGLPWSYQGSDWSWNEQDLRTRILQADLIAMPVPGFTSPATASLAAQSITTTPGVTAVFDPRAGQLQLQPDPGSTPSGIPVQGPEFIDVGQQPPWTQRALLHQALQDPSGTATGKLTGQGRVTAPGTVTRGPLPIVPSPPPWVLGAPLPDPPVSQSTPVMVGKFGLNTVEVAVADGSGHTATAATTVVILPGPPLYAISAKHSGSCLTITGGETAVTPGASAQQWPWAGSRNQMWSLGPPLAGGGYSLAADHSGLPLGVNFSVPSGDYGNWRACNKCAGLFLNDGSVPTICAGGGTHDAGASRDYLFVKGVSVRMWPQCTKCSCLFGDIFNGVRASVCPAGGGHTAEDAPPTRWGTAPGETPGPDSPTWQWCSKCGMLVMLVPATAPPGVCPAGGGHNTTGSATLVLPATTDVNGSPLAQGDPGGPWQFLPAPDPRYHLIQRQDNRKVAEVAGASAACGAVIDQWDRLGGDNQQWRLTPVAEIDPAAYYTVTAKHSGKVLEVHGGPTARGDGYSVDQASSNGQANQRWRFLPNADGSYTIVAEHSGYCLGLPGEAITFDGAPVSQYRPLPWATPGINEQVAENWLLVPTQPGYYKIQSGASGMVLTVQGASTADGTPVQQSAWTGADSQQWSLSLLTDLDPDAWYTITARHSGLSLGVVGGPSATQDGALIEQALPANAANQRWRLQPAAGDSYLLIPQHTTLFPGIQACLDLAGGSPADGATIQQWTQTGGTNQQWQILPVEPGCYKIQNLASGKVLQVTGGPSAAGPGTLVQQWTWLGSDNQQWRLTR